MHCCQPRFFLEDGVIWLLFKKKGHYYKILVGERENETDRQTDRQTDRELSVTATNVFKCFVVVVDVVVVVVLEDNVVKSTVRKRYYCNILVVFALPLRTSVIHQLRTYVIHIS